MPKSRPAPPRDDLEEDRSRLLALVASGLAVGALAGLVGSAFNLALVAAEQFRGFLVDGAHRNPGWGWVVPVFVAAGAAFVARWLVGRYALEASGSGVQRVEAIIRGDAVALKPAVLPVKFVGGVLALGAGLALGREGPTVQMAAFIGQAWARLFKLRPGDHRALLAAGAGAGLAAAFNAPLAGVIFVFEELLRRFELRVAVATLSACSGGLVIMRTLIGDRLVFAVPPIVVDLFPGYFLFLGLGVVMGALGMVYSRMVVAGLDISDRMLRVRPEMQAAVVGGAFGLLAFVAPGVIGGGESQVQAMLDGSDTFVTIAILFSVRFVLGPLSYAPGLPGGLFAPLLVIGAAAGLLFGRGLESTIPELTPPLAALAAVGMGALFVAVVGAPLTGIALVVEMTGATTCLCRFSPLARVRLPYRRCSAAGRSTTRCGIATLRDTRIQRGSDRVAGVA
jgi:CIC family chloride channel protein